MNRRDMLLAGIAAGLLLCGCAMFSTPLPPEQKPDSASGYLFGRFTLTRGHKSLLNTMRMGLHLQSEDGGQFLVEFYEKGDGISAIAVPPGNYKIVGMTSAYGDGEQGGSWQIGDPNVTTSFQVSAGTAYYLGDYSGTADKRLGPMAVEGLWHLNTIGCSDQTILDFKAKYPDIGRLPVVKPLTLPPKNPRTDTCQ